MYKSACRCQLRLFIGTSGGIGKVVVVVVVVVERVVERVVESRGCRVVVVVVVESDLKKIKAAREQCGHLSGPGRRLTCCFAPPREEAK